METLKIDKYLSDGFKDSDFFQLYSFATENIDSYMQFFDLKDKSLLTVGSSSDQAINATMARCSDIVVSDICPLTKHFYYLKLAALLTLDREDFLKFLYSNYIDNKSFLSKSIFNKIKDTLKSLDYESYYIWEYLFNNYSKSDISRLFRRDVNSLDSIKYCNRYLKNDYNYNHAKETVMNVSVDFIISDITEFSIDKSFDNIWLSNVAYWLSSEEIISMIKNNINMLNDNGKILLCYFWNTCMTLKGFPIEGLSYVDAERKNVAGIKKGEDKNSILVYTKK